MLCLERAEKKLQIPRLQIPSKPTIFKQKNFKFEIRIKNSNDQKILIAYFVIVLPHS
jgi:hypothetical protein